MRAYHLDQPGSTDGIALHERSEPKPGATEILVRVHAASLNKRDLFIGAGSDRLLFPPLARRQGAIPLGPRTNAKTRSMTGRSRAGRHG
jgi:NADPH:quinone reductase-like Zn-dependent oxidoreductase